MLKLDTPFRDKETFDYLSFFYSSDLSFEQKVVYSFWLIFCPLHLYPGSLDVVETTKLDIA